MSFGTIGGSKRHRIQQEYERRKKMFAATREGLPEPVKAKAHLISKKFPKEWGALVPNGVEVIPGITVFDMVSAKGVAMSCVAKKEKGKVGKKFTLYETGKLSMKHNREPVDRKEFYKDFGKEE